MMSRRETQDSKMPRGEYSQWAKDSESDSDEAIAELTKHVSKKYDTNSHPQDSSSEDTDVKESDSEESGSNCDIEMDSPSSLNLRNKDSAHTDSSDEELDKSEKFSSPKTTSHTKVKKGGCIKDKKRSTSELHYNHERLQKDSSDEETDSSSSSSDGDFKAHPVGKRLKGSLKAEGESDNDSLQDKEESSDEEDNEEEEYARIRAEIADMPFEELQKLKETVGMKMFNQAMSKGVFKNATKRTFTRENKNRPMEVSSKRTGHKSKKSVEKKKVHRDPRFDDLSGEYNETYFKQAYSFLSDVKTREKQKLIKKFKKEKDEEKKAKLDVMIKRLTQQEKAAREKEATAQKDRIWKQKQNELVKKGKNPYYLKDSTKKTLQLADKYTELKKSGKVENYMAKKRKKNAMKERKQLPAKT